MREYRTDRYYIFDIEWVSIHRKMFGLWIMTYEKQVSTNTLRYVNEKVKFLKEKGYFVFERH